jgi:hypothetical protein
MGCSDGKTCESVQKVRMYTLNALDISVGSCHVVGIVSDRADTHLTTASEGPYDIASVHTNLSRLNWLFSVPPVIARRSIV